MYKLIKAKPIHAKQILPYLTMTCYWKEFAEGNNLSQSYEDFMLQWIINPRIPLTTVLVKEGEDESKIYGAVITGTTEQFGAMPDYSPHLHPRVLEVFGPWFQFPVVDSVVVELIFVAKELRGQGYGSKLYKIAEDLAKSAGKDAISGFIWASFPNSLINAIRKGRMITGAIHFPEITKMPLLYLVKSPEYTELTDYFQSEKYLQAKNMLLS